MEKKIADHHQERDHFAALLEGRIQQLEDDVELRGNFVQELRRFLPPEVAKRTVENEAFWEYSCNTVSQEKGQVLRYIGGADSTNSHFKM